MIIRATRQSSESPALERAAMQPSLFLIYAVS
jgi:hypothetical protein